MIPTRLAALPALSLLLLLAAGCASAPPPPPRPVAEPETQAQRCARMQAGPHPETPPQKLEGAPAVLTPEGRAAGLHDAMSATCVVTFRGRLFGCRVAEEVPVSQRLAVGVALNGWRFQSGTRDGAPVAGTVTVSVPLIDPPPGWTVPQGDQPTALHHDQRPPGPPMRIVLFRGDMTPPQRIDGVSAPGYTPKARELCVEGKLIARCTIMEDGTLTDCDVIQSVPYQDESVLANLATRRYTPVLLQGKPQRVYYTLPFTFRMP
jgi:TonB family protein